MRIITLLAFLFFGFQLMAQNPVYLQLVSSPQDRAVANILKQNVGDSWENTWNVGSAKKLQGSLYLLEVWLTRPGTVWDYDEMSDMQGKINSAVDWLTYTAASYGKPLSVKVGSYAGDGHKGIPISGLPASYAEATNSGNLLVRALNIIGYPGIMECYSQLHNDMHCDNVAVLVLINNNGWSCANQYSTAHTMYGYESYFLENAFIFLTVDGVPASAQSIAHELLHLFGAWDMYQPQASPAADSWAHEHFPNEIMLTVSKPLSEHTISPLTAWLTGLSTSYQDWYMYFRRVANQ